MKKLILSLMLLVPLCLWAEQEGTDLVNKPAKTLSAQRLNKKKLLSITQSRDNSSRTGVLDYDDKGRVAKYTITRNGATSEYNYTYSENMIEITCARSRGTDAYDFTIESGRVVSAKYSYSGDNMTEDFTYEYDGEQHLTKITEVLQPKGNTTTYEYQWTGDDRQSLTLYKNGRLRATEEYIYSEMTSEPLIHALFGYGLYGAGTVYIDEEYATMALYPYMGVLPKNLYSSISSSDIYSGRTETDTYNYSYETNSNGDIVKVNIDDTTYILEWEDTPSVPDKEKELHETEEGGEDYGNGGSIDGGSDLDGNIIGNVYYSIASGKGGYDAVEGCIVLNEPTDDSDIEGKDIFGEDFRNHFTGLVIKVAAGSGTVKLNAQTTGNMVLKVKIGTGDPIEMVLSGKLNITIPYNVMQPTYIYIYASMFGASARATASTSGNALKIYGLSWQDATDIDTPKNGVQAKGKYYTIDGRQLDGCPARKGIYIVDGRKIVVK